MKTKSTNSKLGKKFWYYLAVGVGVIVLAASLVTTILLLSKDDPFLEKPTNDPELNNPTNDPNEDPNGPVASVQDDFIFPIEAAEVLHTYGFYYNQTLNAYYEHEGIDFKAEEGASVCAIADGTVESVYVEDVLRGGQITIVHEDGVKSVYSFVTAESGLKAGDKVEQGDVIATVSEANGEEYKDGAHLHLEIYADGELVDPEAYLPFEEK